MKAVNLCKAVGVVIPTAYTILNAKWVPPDLRQPTRGVYLLDQGVHFPFAAWEGLELPELQPGEALLLPPPRLRPLPEWAPGTAGALVAPFEMLPLVFGSGGLGGTVQ